MSAAAAAMSASPSVPQPCNPRARLLKPWQWEIGQVAHTAHDLTTALPPASLLPVALPRVAAEATRVATAHSTDALAKDTRPYLLVGGGVHRRRERERDEERTVVDCLPCG